MGGVLHTAFDTIGDPRHNLRDRYKDCHVVLKELIQNADDASATDHRGYRPGRSNGG